MVDRPRNTDDGIRKEIMSNSPPFEKRGGERGDLVKVLKYNAKLKHNARQLRREMTDSERALWARLRGKQILDVQFYRQKPIGRYIVDFYASWPRIVVEVDGGQHMETDQEQKDAHRDIYLKNEGLFVLRFNNLQFLQELDSVMEVIYQTIKERLNPPGPLFQRGKHEGGEA